MSVTMADVARTAGVNKATVSRVLKGDPRISTATAEKVWKVVRELGYQPNVVARGLSSSSTGTVAAVFEDLARPWAGAFLGGLDRVLASRGQVAMLFSTGGDPGSRSRVSRSLSARRVDGIVWLDPVPTFPEAIPCLSVGHERLGEAAIVLDHAVALEGIRRLAGEREPVYRGAPSGTFGALGLPEEPAGNGEPFVVYDGILPDRPLNGNGLICGDPATARSLACPCMDWPWFDLGVLAARILFNRIHGKGVRPDLVRVPPRFYPLP